MNASGVSTASDIILLQLSFTNTTTPPHRVRSADSLAMILICTTLDANAILVLSQFVAMDLAMSDERLSDLQCSICPVGDRFSD